MKNLAFILGLVLSAVVYGADVPASSPEPLDRIVAVVNQEIVTQSELDQMLAQARAQMTAMQIPAPPETVLRNQVLNQLINQKLETQIAKKMNIKVTPAQVNEAIQGVAKQNNLTVDQLKQKLSQEGINYNQYEKNIEKQLVLQQLLQQVAGNNISVTKFDISQFINDFKKQQQTSGMQYHLLDILVSLPDNANKDQDQVAQTKAQDIAQKLKQGADANQLYANQIDVQVQDLGWRTSDNLPSIFTAPLATLNKGEVAGPLKAANGYHVIQLLDKQGAEVKLPPMPQIQQIIYQQKMQKELQKWLQELRKQSYIRITDPSTSTP